MAQNYSISKLILGAFIGAVFFYISGYYLLGRSVGIAMLSSMFGFLLILVFSLIATMKEVSESSRFWSPVLVEAAELFWTISEQLFKENGKELLTIERVRSRVPVPENPFKDFRLEKELGFYGELPQSWKPYSEQLQRARDGRLSVQDITDLKAKLKIERNTRIQYRDPEAAFLLASAIIWLSSLMPGLDRQS